MNLNQQLIDYEGKPMTHHKKDADGKKIKELPTTLKDVLRVSLMNRLEGRTEKIEESLCNAHFTRERYELFKRIDKADGVILTSDEVDVLNVTLPLSHEVLVSGQVLNIIHNEI